MKPALVSRRAQNDLEEIRQNIARDKPDAAERVWRALLDTADLLADNIQAGQAILHAAPRHGGLEKVAGAMAAQVDLNPQRVDVALFAFDAAFQTGWIISKEFNPQNE